MQSLRKDNSSTLYIDIYPLMSQTIFSSFSIFCILFVLIGSIKTGSPKKAFGRAKQMPQGLNITF